MENTVNLTINADGSGELDGWPFDYIATDAIVALGWQAGEAVSAEIDADDYFDIVGNVLRYG